MVEFEFGKFFAQIVGTYRIVKFLQQNYSAAVQRTFHYAKLCQEKWLYRQRGRSIWITVYNDNDHKFEHDGYDVVYLKIGFMVICFAWHVIEIHCTSNTDKVSGST